MPLYRCLFAGTAMAWRSRRGVTGEEQEQTSYQQQFPPATTHMKQLLSTCSDSLCYSVRTYMSSVSRHAMTRVGVKSGVVGE